MVFDGKIAIAFEDLLLFGETLLAFPVLDLAGDLGECFGVAQRGRVAKFLIQQEVPQETPHILPAAHLREGRDLNVVLGNRNGTLLGAHQLVQATAVIDRQLAAGHGQDEGERGQTLLAMRCTDDDCVAHRRVGRDLLVAQQRALDLLGAHAVPGDVDHVVRAAVQGEAAVRVLHRVVTLHVGPLPLGTALIIGPDVALGIPLPAGQVAAGEARREAFDVAPDHARQVGVRGRDHDLAFLLPVRAAIAHGTALTASRNPHVTHDPGQRIGVRIRASG